MRRQFKLKPTEAETEKIWSRAMNRTERTSIEQKSSRRRPSEILLKICGSACGGSAAKLMIRVLEAKPTSEAELEEIRRLIDEAERRERR